MKPSILVVGFGNSLAGDDGAGIAVIQRLHRTGLPAYARAAVGGSDSLTIPDLWKGERDVWLVDAVVGGAPPGSIHRLDHEQVLALPQRHVSAHRLSLPESLRWIELARPEMNDVRYRLWGVEPGLLRHVEDLTPPVRRAVGPIAAEIRQWCLAQNGNGTGIGNVYPSWESRADRGGVLKAFSTPGASGSP